MQRFFISVTDSYIKQYKANYNIPLSSVRTVGAVTQESSTCDVIVSFVNYEEKTMQDVGKIACALILSARYHMSHFVRFEVTVPVLSSKATPTDVERQIIAQFALTEIPLVRARHQYYCKLVNHFIYAVIHTQNTYIIYTDPLTTSIACRPTVGNEPDTPDESQAAG
jgi:hypothetical protein